jgi:hypothetical protein
MREALRLTCRAAAADELPVGVGLDVRPEQSWGDTSSTLVHQRYSIDAMFCEEKIRLVANYAATVAAYHSAVCDLRDWDDHWINRCLRQTPPVNGDCQVDLRGRSAGTRRSRD